MDMELNELRPLGAVLVAAEQNETSDGEFVLREQQFLLYIAASRSIGDEEAKDIAGDVIGSSAWEKAIVAMPEGQIARLPSPRSGVYCVVKRLADAAGIAITDFQPAYDVDWTP
jgi:hypothetical protein